MKRIDPKTKPRKPDDAPVPAQRAAVDLTSKTTPSEPSLPHERDQSVAMTGGVPSGVVQQAARDLKRGLEDTGRAPEADRTYKKLKK
ncbi:MAG: hypothetical protein ABI433_06045 [Burkholderiaceae bacterium]